MQIVTLEELVSLKLYGWAHNPTRRLKDKADVVESIKYRNLPRDLAINPAVRTLYTETWAHFRRISKFAGRVAMRKPTTHPCPIWTGAGIIRKIGGLSKSQTSPD